jgi:hypothetical protein
MGEWLKVVFEPNFPTGGGRDTASGHTGVGRGRGRGMSRENQIVLKSQTWTRVMRALLLLCMEGGKD